MEQLQTGYSQVSSQQAEEIFRALTKKTKLKKLNVSNINLSFIEPDILARAVTGLEEVKLGVSPESS